MAHIGTFAPNPGRPYRPEVGGRFGETFRTADEAAYFVQLAHRRLLLPPPDYSTALTPEQRAAVERAVDAFLAKYPDLKP